MSDDERESLHREYERVRARVVAQIRVPPRLAEGTEDDPLALAQTLLAELDAQYDAMQTPEVQDALARAFKLDHGVRHLRIHDDPRP